MKNNKTSVIIFKFSSFSVVIENSACVTISHRMLPAIQWIKGIQHRNAIILNAHQYFSLVQLTWQFFAHTIQFLELTRRRSVTFSNSASIRFPANNRVKPTRLACPPLKRLNTELLACEDETCTICQNACKSRLHYHHTRTSSRATTPY